MKQKKRGLISLGLLVFWTTAVLSGFVLALAPSGRRSGKALLFFNLSKGEWSNLHTWFSLLALGITVCHVIADWQILKALIKNLFLSERTS